jgi:hypothetical protein
MADKQYVKKVHCYVLWENLRHETDHFVFTYNVYN